MSKTNVRLKYKELQIIKHSLQNYLNRENASEKETEVEQRLLDKITNEVEIFKEKCGLKVGE